MSAYDARRHSFAPSPSVRAARERKQYVACSVCGQSSAEYLFFRRGVRFVRCSGCGLVYVSPVGGAGPCYFDVAEVGRLVSPRDRQLAAADLEQTLQDLARAHTARRGSPPRRTVLLGRYFPELSTNPDLVALGLRLIRIDGAPFARLSEHSDLSAFTAELDADLVVLNELLEACSDPGKVLGQVAAALPRGATLAVTYADAGSLPARALRQHWPAFFDVKRAFFGLSQLTRLAERHGLVLKAHRPLTQRRTPRYALHRILDAAPSLQGALAKLAPTSVAVPLLTGLRLAIFERAVLASAPAEKLSIVLPVYEEAATVRQVIEAVLAKPLRIDRELIIVESGSRDGTGEIVSEYAKVAGVTIVREPAPRGKGNAVKTGLRHCTGSIVLIQDADLEYDVEDYDALLEPILQGRTNFVLGSRTLGAGGWKVRRFARGALRGMLLNAAQVGFAGTFNALYQQRATDVNTMFKVFRRSCLEQIELESDGFELDIELACRLVLAGYAPLEVPVNYVARDFSQGKKIRFLRDAWRGYAAFFKYRLRRANS